MPGWLSGLLRYLLAFGAGALVLYLGNLLFDPVPVAAGPAFALGVAGFLILRRKPLVGVAGLAIAGAAAGVYIHRGWHLEGSSPPPAEGLWPHLVAEGFMGLAAAALALLVMGLVLGWLGWLGWLGRR